jgi:hypothetical protein
LVDEYLIPLFVARAKSPLSVKRALLASTGVFLKVFKQKDARGLLHGELQEQRDLRVWPYGHGNHAFWHDDGY